MDEQVALRCHIVCSPDHRAVLRIWVYHVQDHKGLSLHDKWSGMEVAFVIVADHTSLTIVY